MSGRIIFQHTLNSRALAVCLAEILKYVLYIKVQIPLPVDQLLKHGAYPHPSPLPVTAPEKRPSSWKEKQLQDRLDRLQQLLTNIQAMCAACDKDVKEVAIVLGTTLIHPSAVIRISPEAGLLDSSAPALAQDNLKRFLVKSLISFSFETCHTDTAATNCFVMIKALRSLEVDPGTAVPRMSFNLSSKKNYFCIEVVKQRVRHSKEAAETQACKHSQPTEGCTSCIKTQGREPPTVEWEDHLLTMVQNLSLAERGRAQDNTSGRDDWIWFQVVPVFQGFRDLPHSTHNELKTKSSLSKHSKPLGQSNDGIWA